MYCLKQFYNRENEQLEYSVSLYFYKRYNYVGRYTTPFPFYWKFKLILQFYRDSKADRHWRKTKFTDRNCWRKFKLATKNLFCLCFNWEKMHLFRESLDTCTFQIPIDLIYWHSDPVLTLIKVFVLFILSFLSGIWTYKEVLHWCNCR